MGLDISAPSKSYHAGYHALHMVRELALLDCGYPDDLEGFPSFYVVPANLDSKRLSAALLAFQLSGLYYPNLMLHSDCEGKYTRGGKVATNGKDAWMTGNSVGLLRELEELAKTFTDEVKAKRARAISVFDMLHAVVKDAVENGKGTIEFH